jgi:iron(III) transport system substrate-binding protein
MKNAPHPYSALLFADFLLSPEAQQMLSNMGRPQRINKSKPSSTTITFSLN